MGVKALPRIAERLVAGGRPPDQPVAVVERGTLPGQKTVVATLADIAARAAGIRAPAITLVGDVAGLREQIAWLESRPLFGRTVAVTRARAQASALAERLRGLGADVVEAPAIRTRAARRSRSRTCLRTTCCASHRRPAPPTSSTTSATRATWPA